MGLQSKDQKDSTGTTNNASMFKPLGLALLSLQVETL